MRTLAKGRARLLIHGIPRMTWWERDVWRRRAERDGYRPGETCTCERPAPGFGGGDRYYIGGICVNPGCYRGLRPEEQGECVGCGERAPGGECSGSRRECGHHCNHSWTHDACCWCGETFGEQEDAA